MFTGIIESICTVKMAQPARGGYMLMLELGSLAQDAKPGDSIAVNGTCLTITKLSGQIAQFDLSAETIKKSALGSLLPGSKVNVEKAMQANGRFDGHIVQGHIDAVAIIKSIERQGDFYNLKFAAEPDVLDYIVPKGSVAIDGISLTLTEVDSKSFAVTVIPTTWDKTILHLAKIGDKVNIETDIIAKMIKKQLEKVLDSNSSLTVEKLKELGF
jgi:riboflavin synthase